MKDFEYLCWYHDIIMYFDNFFSADWVMKSSCKLGQTVRPWNRTIAVQFLHNAFVICYEAEGVLYVACVQKYDDVVSVQANVFPLMELENQDTVRFLTTPTSAIVIAKGKMMIFDSFTPSKNDHSDTG